MVERLAKRAQMSLASSILPPCPMQKTCLASAEHPCGLIHGLGREGVLSAVDGGKETGAGVFKERLGGSPGLKLPLAGHGAGGVGLRQRNAHLVVARRTRAPGRTGTPWPRRHCTPGPERKWKDTAPHQRAVRGSRPRHGRISSTGPAAAAAVPKNSYPYLCSFGQAGPQCPQASAPACRLPVRRAG